MGLRDLVLLAIYVVGIPASFLEPFVGILFWAWISYFNPQDFTWGFASHIPIGFLVAIPTLIGLVFTKRKQSPPLTLETVLLAMLWLWFAVTTANVFVTPVLEHHLSDTLGAMWKVSKILAMAFVALMLVTEPRRLRWWYLITAGSFALFALKTSVWGVFTGGQFRAYGPRNSMIYDNNDFGLAMNMALPMFVALARTEQSRALRWCFWAAVPMGIMTIILTYSRGALLGLAMVLLALVVKSKRRWLGFGALLVVGIITFAEAPGQWFERMQTLRDVQQDRSVQARLRSWTFSYLLFRDHPLLGGGFQTYTAPLYARYSLLTERVQGPHSIYFQVLAEHGLPGLTLFLLLAGSCFWNCGRLAARFEQQEGSEHLAAYANMAQLSLVPFFVSGAFLGRAYFDLYYQLVVTVILLKQFARDEAWETQTSLVLEESPAFS